MRAYDIQTHHDLTHHLFLHGMVTEESCVNLYADIVRGPVPPAKCFTLHINSNGGECDAAFALIHAIFQSEYCVTTVGAGTVGSAALDIFVSGHVRKMAESTTSLVHSATFGNASSRAKKMLKKLEIDRDFKLWRACSNIKTRDEYDAIFRRHDTWVSASYLFELGAVDYLT